MGKNDKDPLYYAKDGRGFEYSYLRDAHNEALQKTESEREYGPYFIKTFIDPIFVAIGDRALPDPEPIVDAIVDELSEELREPVTELVMMNEHLFVPVSRDLSHISHMSFANELNAHKMLAHKQRYFLDNQDTILGVLHTSIVKLFKDVLPSSTTTSSPFVANVRPPRAFFHRAYIELLRLRRFNLCEAAHESVRRNLEQRGVEQPSVIDRSDFSPPKDQLVKDEELLDAYFAGTRLHRVFA